MEEIYQTEKKPEQTLEEFTANVHKNLDIWIEQLRKKRDAQDRLVSLIYVTVNETIRDGRKHRESLEKELRSNKRKHPDSHKQALESTIDTLEVSEEIQAKRFAPNTLRIPYQQYVNTLTKIKQENAGKGGLVKPRIVAFPSILSSSNVESDKSIEWTKFRVVCTIPLNAPREETIPITTYATMLKNKYATYIQILGKNATNVLSQQQFNDQVDTILNSLREFDILDIGGSRVEGETMTGYKFVFSVNNRLVVYQENDECGLWLPIEFYPMLKQFGICTQEDLSRLYDSEWCAPLGTIVECTDVICYVKFANIDDEDYVLLNLDGHVVRACIEVEEAFWNDFPESLRVV